jgi:lipoprotein-anchoring transpeptidase ErfK/SrfK
MPDRLRFVLLTRRIGSITVSKVAGRSSLGAVAASATAVVLAALVAGCGGSQPSSAPPSFAASPAASFPTPRPVTAAELTQLPQATTYGHLKGAATDPQPFAAGSGLVVHPREPWVVYASPGGPPVAVLPSTEMGSPTWVPVVQSQQGWDMVLLPSRPDRSVGWVPTENGALETAHSPYQIRVNTTARRITLLKDGSSLGSWPVAVGAPGTPTPPGRTFVLASLVPAQPTYSWLILPTGTHSNSLETYGGGPGTVGLHTWPDSSVFGHAVSHGCVRVPAAGLRMLSHVPLGSLVMITS